MTSIQKIIKYFSLAFAAFLIVSITYGIMMVFYSLSLPLGLNKDDGETNNKNLLCGEAEFNSIKIDIDKSDLDIKMDSKFMIEANSDNIICKVSNNKLVIKEKDKIFFKSPQKVIIYLPYNVNYRDVEIETDAGNVNIDDITAMKLDLELGAGKNVIRKIDVYDASIETGAGELRIDDGNINNLELDMGAGKIDITSRLSEISKIEAGAGYLKLNLIGKMDDYKLKVETGIGKTRVSGSTIKSNEIIGNGSSFVTIEAGIGEVDIDYLDESK